jgi:transposase InsO family protein
VVETFITTMDQHGPPAATLTDNGMVYTTRLAGLKAGRNTQPKGFEQLLADLGIDQRNGAPGHPTTQGKIERFHQTLKRWLRADGLRDTVEELNTQLARFTTTYNIHRPHRALDRRTPEAVYTSSPKAQRVVEIGPTIWRVRYDPMTRDSAPNR